MAIVWSVLLMFASCALGQTNLPILVGDGRDLITVETVATLSGLTKSARGEAADIWMLDGLATREEKPRLHAAEVLFSPKNSTGRVLRCHGIHCDKAGVDYWSERWSPSSFTLIGGWYFYHDNQPDNYCWIAPKGQKIANKPVGDRYHFSRNLTDTDLIALFDATRRSTTNAPILGFESRDLSHASVWTSGEQWVVEFEKRDNFWKETNKTQWIE